MIETEECGQRAATINISKKLWLKSQLIRKLKPSSSPLYISYATKHSGALRSPRPAPPEIIELRFNKVVGDGDGQDRWINIFCLTTRYGDYTKLLTEKDVAPTRRSSWISDP